MRRTKIIATVGPATRSREMLEALIGAGVDVVRLNFSHGTREEHGRVIELVRSVSLALGRPVAVLQDLAGPKIRIGPIEDAPVRLRAGAAFTLTGRDVPGDGREVSLTYRDLPKDVRAGDRLLLSDGEIELVVEKTEEDDIRCRVITGGLLHARKGINLPARTITAPFLTDKDREDLAFGLDHGVDYVALSFVRSADDVRAARECVEASGRNVPLIAKIEKHEALGRIDGILAAVDGLMVARGDLGVEIPLEEVPGVQKSLIEKTNRAGKPVITATQMLRSMVDSPRPTRAEVADVANAILDGSDAVMLSEETAIGSHPVGAVEIMSRIAEGAEAGFPHGTWSARYGRPARLETPEAVAHAACQLADEIGAGAIVTCTQSGSTTRLVAKYRPARPILAVTADEATRRRLAMVWGTVPLRIESVDSAEDMERLAVRAAAQSGVVEAGERMILVAGVPLHVAGITNLIKIVLADPEA